LNRNAAMKFLLFCCYKIQTLLAAAVATASEISIILQLPWEFVSPRNCHKNVGSRGVGISSYRWQATSDVLF